MEHIDDIIYGLIHSQLMELKEKSNNLLLSEILT